MTLIMPTPVQCWGHGCLCLINVSVPVQDLRSTSIYSAFGGIYAHLNDAAPCLLPSAAATQKMLLFEQFVSRV